MPSSFASAARIAANRLNAQRSTGPKTAAGKERSRANALKHGLTGAGIALPAEDRAVVEERFLAIQAELGPGTVVGAALAHQVALMTVRLQRAARHEAATVAARVRRAAADFDEARAAEADHLLGWIESEPATQRRRLLALPEGVDRLVAALLGLRGELDRDGIVWTYVHEQKLEAYFGRRPSDIPHSRGYRLSRGLGGDFAEIDPAETAHLATLPERQTWAADQLIAVIDAEVERLRAHRATLDHDAIALDRAEAGERALFDPGKEATLARKYEAAASRGLYRALREFHAVEAVAAPAPPPADAALLDLGDAVEVGPDPDEAEPGSDRGIGRDDRLASFGGRRGAASVVVGRGAGPGRPAGDRPAAAAAGGPRSGRRERRPPL